MPAINIMGASWIKLEQMRLKIQRELGKKSNGQYPQVSWTLVMNRFFVELKQSKGELKIITSKLVDENLHLQQQILDFEEKLSRKRETIKEVNENNHEITIKAFDTIKAIAETQRLGNINFQANPQVMQQNLTPPPPPSLPPARHMTDEQIEAMQDQDSKTKLQTELIETINGKDVTKLLISPPKEELEAILKARKERRKKPFTIPADFVLHTEKHPEKFLQQNNL